MSIIKNPEDEFIQELEGYLNTKFDRYSVSRIINILNKYKEEIPPKTIVKKASKRIKYMYIDTAVLKLCTEDDIIREAKEICAKYGMDYERFKKPKSGKSTVGVTDLRKIFCKFMLLNYKIARKQLQDFFNVDHSTIIFYINDNYKPRIKKSA